MVETDEPTEKIDRSTVQHGDSTEKIDRSIEGITDSAV